MNKEKIRTFLNKKTVSIPVLTCVGVLLLSITWYLIFSPGTRVVLLFESMDNGELYGEPRYIPKEATQGEIAYFIDELLLGPISNRYKPLFANGTKALSSFLSEDNVLYVNLNEIALLQGNSSSETIIACELLKKNVLKNYNYVDTIKVFIMGNLVN